MPGSREIAVRREPEAYVLSSDGQDVGKLVFRDVGGTLVLVHTEVDPAHEGEHLGSELVRSALEDVRQRGERIRPLCPFVVDYLDRHPEFADLVTD